MTKLTPSFFGCSSESHCTASSPSSSAATQLSTLLHILPIQSLSELPYQVFAIMPIVDDFQLPASAHGLQFPNTPTSTTKFFVLFLSSTDPATKQPWCSDVRAALPLLNATFTSETSPSVHYVYVGLKPEYVAFPETILPTYHDCYAQLTHGVDVDTNL